MIADRFRLAWTPFLKKTPTGMRQALAVICPTVLGSGGQITFATGRRKQQLLVTDLLRYPSENYRQDDPVTYLWMLPQPRRPIPIRAVWRTPSGTIHRAAIVLRPAEPRNVHVTFKTHLDLGYTATLRDVIGQYQTTLLDRLLANLDATADRPVGLRFVWTLSTWLLEQLLDPEHVSEQRRARLEQHIRRGTVVWGLMPFTTHSEFFGLEEMCRSMYAARELAQRFGQPVPRAAKMTDVPAHPAALALALKGAGGEFLQIGVNPESIMPKVPPLFWWKLPDGQRLLCHYHGTYGTPLLPPEDWPWADWLALQMTSDNVGPGGLETLERIDWISSHFDFPRCRTGRLEDFSDAVIRNSGHSLPVIEKEFTDWWSYGLASQAAATAVARTTKHRLASAEVLHTLSHWGTDHQRVAATEPPTDAAYRQLTLYTEHTWGDHANDMKLAAPKGNLYRSPVFGPDSRSEVVQRWTASWADKAAFSARAGELTTAVENAATAAWAGELSPKIVKDRLSIALFNTLNWPRGGVVHLSDPELPHDEFELVDASTGAVVPWQRHPDGGIEFLAPPVPACGYLLLEINLVHRRYRPGPAADWDGRRLALHTADYSLQFHQAGGLARWHDRAHSTQWCSDQVEFPLGTYLYEMPGGDRIRSFARQVQSNHNGFDTGFHRRDYGDLKSIGPVAATPASVSAEVGAACARIRMEAACPALHPAGRRSGNARRCRTSFTLYHGSPDLHVRLQLFGKSPTFAAEAGYAFFPFSGEEPYILIDRIAQLTDPAGDLAGSVNAAHVVAHRGVRIQQQHTGMNFYPLHTPLVGFGHPGAYRFDAGGKHAGGVLYASLFNNCWGTNFALWQCGDFSFDFVLRPTGNDNWDGGLLHGGAELFQPLIARVLRGSGPGLTGLPPAQSLLRIDPPAVHLVALKPASFGRGTIIRLWNSDPEPISVKLEVLATVRSRGLTVCDLLERPTGRRIPLSRSGQAKWTLRGHEIATLLLETPRRAD